MKEERTLEQRTHDRLLGIRRRIKESMDIYGVTWLAGDLIHNLAIAAEKGKLRQDQYRAFNSLPRSVLMCDFLAITRDILGANRENVDVRYGHIFRTDNQLEDYRRTFELSRRELHGKYNVEDWLKIIFKK